jgi:hypothetical protein
MEKLDVHTYFDYPETLRPMELVYGMVREPAMPAYAGGARRSARPGVCVARSSTHHP